MNPATSWIEELFQKAPQMMAKVELLEIRSFRWTLEERYRLRKRISTKGPKDSRHYNILLVLQNLLKVEVMLAESTRVEKDAFDYEKKSIPEYLTKFFERKSSLRTGPLPEVEVLDWNPLTYES